MYGNRPHAANAVAFTTMDGQPVAITGRKDCAVHAWDLTTGTLPVTLTGSARIWNLTARAPHPASGTWPRRAGSHPCRPHRAGALCRRYSGDRPARNRHRQQRFHCRTVIRPGLRTHNQLLGDCDLILLPKPRRKTSLRERAAGRVTSWPAPLQWVIAVWGPAGFGRMNR